MTVSYRVGVDIGGTFTDIVLLGSDGSIRTKKVASSVENYAQAIVEGLGEVFRESGIGGLAIEEIRHARGWDVVPKVQWQDPPKPAQKSVQAAE